MTNKQLIKNKIKNILNSCNKDYHLTPPVVKEPGYTILSKVLHKDIIIKKGEDILNFFHDLGNKGIKEATVCSGIMYHIQQDFTTASSYYQKASTPYAYCLLGHISVAQRKTSDAMGYFQKALRDGYYKANLHIADMLFNKKEYLQAITYYNKFTPKTSSDTLLKYSGIARSELRFLMYHNKLPPLVENKDIDMATKIFRKHNKTIPIF